MDDWTSDRADAQRGALGRLPQRGRQMDSQAEIRNLHSEVDRLRYQLRITQGATALIAIMVGLVIALGGQRTPPPERGGLASENRSVLPEVNTRELILRDAAGNERGALRCTRSGQPQLTLAGAYGAKIRLGFYDKPFDVLSLDFRDSSGVERIGVHAVSQQGGGTGISIADENGTPTLSLNYIPVLGSSIGLHASDNKVSHASMSMGKGGFPTIQLIDGKGGLVLDVPP